MAIAPEFPKKSKAGAANSQFLVGANPYTKAETVLQAVAIIPSKVSCIFIALLKSVTATADPVIKKLYNNYY